MAIVLMHPEGKGLIGPANGKAYQQRVDILADTEDEITALGGIGSTVQETGTSMAVKLAAGSMAHTAGYGVIYELSPSGVWTKA